MKLTKAHYIGVALAFIVVLILILGAKHSEAPIMIPSATTTETGATGTPEAQAPATTPSTAASKPSEATKPAVKLTSEAGRLAPDLVKPTGFINSDTLGLINTNEFTLKQFIGKKVILVDFWTSSSLPSMRMFPYFKQWDEKYRDNGLLIVAVHTPRFTYERSQALVQSIVRNAGINFPVVVDNNITIWNAYRNTIWPHQYIIDLSGRVVYDHAGEGGYDQMEAKIDELLGKLAVKNEGSFTPETFKTPSDAIAIDLSKIQSPELFFGATNDSKLANGVALKEGPQSFDTPNTVELNKLYFSGSWNFAKEYTSNMVENSALFTRYRAKNAYALLGSEKITAVKVLLDGKPLDQSVAGSDVRYEKNDSVIYVKEMKLYDIVKGLDYGEHTLELIPTTGGLECYALTFG